MQSGKPSVQLLGSSMTDVNEAFDVDLAPQATNDANIKPLGEPVPELAGHIIGQLRSAYDRLVDEPVPDHLLALVANLSDPEAKS
jgi:hypothetical protein